MTPSDGRDDRREGARPRDRLKRTQSDGVDPPPSRWRSELMSRIRARDTVPELRVRRLVHCMGYRYRLHARELPGRPDLVFRPRRKVIFVHGCFWHRHRGCPANRLPSTRSGFWRSKLDGNVRRDRRNEAALRKKGWSVLVIWECETKNTDRVARTIRRFLDAGGS